MKFSVVSLFNHKSFGLSEPHYAVVSEESAGLGSRQRVLDLFPVSQEADVSRILNAFSTAQKSLPFKRHADGGGMIVYLGKNFDGKTIKQSTAHIPAKPLAGLPFVEKYLDEVCWRARVNLWLHGQNRVALSPDLEARVLKTAEPQVASSDKVPAVVVAPMAVYDESLRRAEAQVATAPYKAPPGLVARPVRPS